MRPPRADARTVPKTLTIVVVDIIVVDVVLVDISWT